MFMSSANAYAATAAQMRTVDPGAGDKGFRENIYRGRVVLSASHDNDNRMKFGISARDPVQGNRYTVELSLDPDRTDCRFSTVTGIIKGSGLREGSPPVVVSQPFRLENFDTNALVSAATEGERFILVGERLVKELSYIANGERQGFLPKNVAGLREAVTDLTYLVDRLRRGNFNLYLR